MSTKLRSRTFCQVPFTPKPRSERSQPRSGDIFVEPGSRVNPSSGGAAYSVAHKWANHIKEPFASYKYFVPNGTPDRFPSLQVLPTALRSDFWGKAARPQNLPSATRHKQKGEAFTFPSLNELAPTLNNLRNFLRLFLSDYRPLRMALPGRVFVPNTKMTVDFI